MSGPEKIRLGELLVRQKLITDEQLQVALEQQKKNGQRLGRVFVECGFVTEESLSRALARQLNISFVNLRSFDLQPAIVKLLSEAQARRFRANH